MGAEGNLSSKVTIIKGGEKKSKLKIKEKQEI